jgi:hypothetical protein
VTGRSLVALLSEPHVQPSAFVANGDLLAQQIAAAQLPFGYSLDWLGPDWVVPSGAYTQSGRTPAQAVAAIAQAAGLMAEPLRDGLGWTVRKVYSTPPWQWGGAIPDRVVGQSVVLQLDRSLALANRGQANAVVVHGGEVQGILASVRIAATAGDRLAATYSDPLITAVVAAQAAGERILAREYRQPPIASLELRRAISRSSTWATWCRSTWATTAAWQLPPPYQSPLRFLAVRSLFARGLASARWPATRPRSSPI